MRKGAKAKPKRASKPRVATPARKRPLNQAASRSAAPADARLVLATDCTLREAPALKARLLATAPSGPQVIIEAGAVERIDAAGLQLLVVFAQRQVAAGRRLTWQSASDELRGAGARLGLLDALGLGAGGP